MRMKAKVFKRMRNGVWKNRGEWTPTYVLDQQRAIGDEYQHFVLDANGKLVCAGVTRHTHMNRAQANQIISVWRRWRNEYDSVFTGVGHDYPARYNQAPATIVVHPIDDPNQQQRYIL